MNNTAVRDELELFRSKRKVPAAIGAVTDGDGIIALESVGVRARDDDAPVNVDDAWHIGSCGKSITALLYGCLVEAGKAQWGTPISELFDDIADIDHSWSTPTIDDLLRCRAGVAANPGVKAMLGSHKSTEPVIDQRTVATTNVLRGSAKDPGTFVYSNLGYGVVGAAIDRLAGMPFEDALNHFIFDPLDVSVGIGPPPTIVGHHPRIRLGPLMAGAGSPARAKGKKPADNPPLLTPAGRFHLSIPDWLTILRVFLNNGQPLVSEDTIELLLHDPGPVGKERSMAMGWASGEQLDVEYAMQGSNTMWAATALLDRDTDRIGVTAANDGRMSVVAGTAFLTAKLLELTR